MLHSSLEEFENFLSILYFNLKWCSTTNILKEDKYLFVSLPREIVKLQMVEVNTEIVKLSVYVCIIIANQLIPKSIDSRVKRLKSGSKSVSGIQSIFAIVPFDGTNITIYHGQKT